MPRINALTLIIAHCNLGARSVLLGYNWARAAYRLLSPRDSRFRRSVQPASRKLSSSTAARGARSAPRRQSWVRVLHGGRDGRRLSRTGFPGPWNESLAVDVCASGTTILCARSSAPELYNGLHDSPADVS